MSYIRAGTAIPPTTAIPPSTAYPGTSAGHIIPHSLNQIPEGRYTQTIYTLLRDGKYKEVVRILEAQVNAGVNNRAAFSLLGYCYYMTEEFVQATKWLVHLP